MNGSNFQELMACPTSPTREVTGLTEKESSKERRSGEDPRFAKPETRRPIKEDSGTYSIVYKRSDR